MAEPDTGARTSAQVPKRGGGDAPGAERDRTVRTFSAGGRFATGAERVCHQGPSQRDQVSRTGFAKRLALREPERSFGISRPVEAASGRAGRRCADQRADPERSEGDVWWS